MAGDLIPPPSPAGKPPPDPEGEPLGSARLEPSTHPAADAATGAAPGRPAPAPFRGRFGFVWGALAGIGVCAAGVLALLVITGRSQEGPVLAPNWSAWEPDTAQMTQGGEAIASHVGLQYKLDGGAQLVQVRSSALELGGEEIGVAVRPLGGGLELLEGDGLLYVLNGLGPNGTVATGAPSKERGRLLLREALELALYSFRYLDDVTMVAVLLPQTAEQAAAGATSQTATQQTRAVFYRPGDLLDQLQAPLARTLSPRTPTPTTMADAEAERVDDLTLRNLFLASIQPLEADRNYLVLVEPDTVE